MQIFRYDSKNLQYIKLNTSKVVVAVFTAAFTLVFTLFSAFNALSPIEDIEESTESEILLKENEELKSFIKLLEEENGILSSCCACSESKWAKEGDLIEALIQVESRGKENAIGDKHLGKPSVGVLQIRPIMVKEVNRILKKQGKKLRYILKDRFSKEKSIEMFKVWKSYYHKSSSFEKIARCWNGGSRGHKSKSTLRYWKKVKKELNRVFE